MEKAFVFGSRKSLVGIISDPQPGVRKHHYPSIILLNAGILHRIGPNRLYVKIARKLASSGFIVLRFDLSGIGDSKARADNLPFNKSAVSETREAMDFLAATRGAQKFILMGICSGADHSLRVACADERVVGAALIDAYAFPTMRHHFYSYRKRLLSPRSWWQFITGKSDLWNMLKSIPRRVWMSRVAKQSEVTQNGGVPPKEKFFADLHALVERGVDLCLLYSGGSPAYFNYRKRLKGEMASLCSAGKLQLKFILGSDHIFTLLSNQELLVSELCDWLSSVARRDACSHTGTEARPLLMT